MAHWAPLHTDLLDYKWVTSVLHMVSWTIMGDLTLHMDPWTIVG